MTFNDAEISFRLQFLAIRFLNTTFHSQSSIVSLTYFSQSFPLISDRLLVHWLVIQMYYQMGEALILDLYVRRSSISFEMTAQQVQIRYQSRC